MADLPDVRWLGGGSGAGKSTVAGLLGERYGLPVLTSDLSLRAHAAALTDLPRVRAFVAASMDERWVLREPAEMLRTFPFFAGDGFDLLLEEVRALPAGPVLVEGFRLLPRLVAPLLGDGGRAVWLLPTPAMRRASFAAREPVRRFWEQTSDPERALANLLARDALFTDAVREEATDRGLPVVDVDGAVPAHALADSVAALLALRP